MTCGSDQQLLYLLMKKCNLITLIILFTIALQSKAQEKNFIDMPYVEVTGSADSMVTPNEIYIKINLSERDSRDRTSLEEQERKMVDVLKKNGINTEKDLTTSDIASNFKTYIFSKNILKTKEYMLKVSTADRMTHVITDLEDAGISNTSIDHVDHSNIKNIRLMVKGKASEDAKSNAAALLKPFNKITSSLLHLTNYDNPNSSGTVIRIRGASTLSPTSSNTTVKNNIQFEKIKVSATVNAKFAIK